MPPTTSIASHDDHEQCYCKYFFSTLPEDIYGCNNCGLKRRQGTSSGYSNLISHLKDTHFEAYIED